MKQCSTCKMNKEDTDYHKKGKEKRTSSMCKSCFSKYCMKRWIQRKVDAVKQLGNVCMDCKQSFPVQVYDFHHTNPSTKDMDWNKMRLVSDIKLQLELSKCVLLCSNCHRIRHIKSIH